MLTEVKITIELSKKGKDKSFAIFKKGENEFLVEANIKDIYDSDVINESITFSLYHEVMEESGAAVTSQLLEKDPKKWIRMVSHFKDKVFPSRISLFVYRDELEIGILYQNKEYVVSISKDKAYNFIKDFLQSPLFNEKNYEDYFLALESF